MRTHGWKIIGLKSYDINFLQCLFPTGICGYLTKDVYMALTELGTFFKTLCVITLNVQVLE